MPVIKSQKMNITLRQIIIKYIASKLMFTVDPLVTKNMTAYAAFELVAQGKTSVTPFPYYVTESRRRKATIGRIISFEKYAALYSNKKVIKINESFIIFALFMLILIVHGIYYLVIKRRVFYVFDIVRLLLNQGAPRQPKNISGKIIFCTFAVISIIYSSTIIEKLMNFVVVLNQESVESFKNLFSSNKRLYAPSNLLTLLEKYYNAYFGSFKTKITMYERKRYRLELLLEDNNVICFLSSDRAKAYVERYKGNEDSPLLKMYELSILALAKALYFVKGSPFVTKFDTITQKLVESGIIEKFDREIITKYILEPVLHVKQDTSNNLATWELLIIYLLGCMISIVFFFFECVRKPHQ